MALVYLVELEGRDAAGVVTTFRYASGTGYNHPSAPGYYEPRVINGLSIKRTVFASGTTTGAVGVGAGTVDLANPDGGLDALIDYGFDGGKLYVYLIDPTQNYSTKVQIGRLTMEQADFGWSKVSIKVRDRLMELESKKLQPNLFLGNNSLPNGLEGVAGDLKGKPKPRTFGKVLNISPPCVNTSRLIFQVNDGAVADIPAVYDRGAGLTKGADYTSQTDMETNAPAAGAYRVWPAGGYFRLGSNPVGQITADVLQGAAAANRTVAQILYAMATGPGGIPTGDVSSSDVTALDAANSAVVGLYVDAESTVRAAMESICNSIGSWFGFDRLGVLRLKRFEAPSGSPVATLVRINFSSATTASAGDIISIERTGTNNPGRGVPAYRATLEYQPNYTVQPSDLAGAVTQDRRNFLALETRQVSSTDATIQLQHPLAPVMAFMTRIDDATAAQTESDRQLALYKVRRDLLETAVKVDETLAPLFDLGAIISVQIPRFGMGAGKLFSIIGIQFDAANNVANLELWG